MLEPEQTKIVQAELVEYIAGAIRSISIEHEVSLDDVLMALLGAQGVPSSTMVARIQIRAAEKSPPRDPRPIRAKPMKVRESRWKIPPFKGPQ